MDDNDKDEDEKKKEVEKLPEKYKGMFGEFKFQHTYQYISMWVFASKRIGLSLLLIFMANQPTVFLFAFLTLSMGVSLNLF